MPIISHQWFFCLPGFELYPGSESVILDFLLTLNYQVQYIFCDTLRITYLGNEKKKGIRKMANIRKLEARKRRLTFL
jgi:hypothetical protein